MCMTTIMIIRMTRGTAGKPTAQEVIRTAR